MSDPFLRKYHTKRARIVELYRQYYHDSINCYPEKLATDLIYLVLRSKVVLSTPQVIKVLGLDASNVRHLQLYSSLERNLTLFLHDVFTKTSTTNLLEYPLTNLREACYEIANRFRPIFFVPVKKKTSVRSNINDDNQTHEEVELFIYAEKYCQMWIIVAILKKLVAGDFLAEQHQFVC